MYHLVWLVITVNVFIKILVCLSFNVEKIDLVGTLYDQQGMQLSAIFHLSHSQISSNPLPYHDLPHP